MIKRSILITLFIVAGVFVLSIIKDKKCSFSKECIVQSTAEQKVKINLPFKNGERIDFDVYMFNFKIGSSFIHFLGETNELDQLNYLIESVTDTVNYKGTERIFVDPDNFYPLRVERKLAMGWDKEEITEIYDIENKSVTIKKIKNSKQIPDLVIEKPTVIQNSVSLLYYCRLIEDFSSGKTISVNLPTKSYELEIKEPVTLDVSFGKHDAYVLEDKKGAFRIWISTDENHFPLKFEYSSFMNKYSMRMRDVSIAKDE